jgi:septum formation protein
MPLWTAAQPLVLASKSNIRGKILASAGLRLEIRPAQIDERAVEAAAGSPGPKAAALLLARAKALAVAAVLPGHIVLGADQTLALGDARFSKPQDRDAAAAQLRALRGNSHSLHSALALVRGGEVLFEYCDSATMTMRNFSDRFLGDYLDLAGPSALASVGAYQIEGAGIHLFERIGGDYFTILGLPLLPLLAYMRQNKFLDG